MVSDEATSFVPTIEHRVVSGSVAQGYMVCGHWAYREKFAPQNFRCEAGRWRKEVPIVTNRICGIASAGPITRGHPSGMVLSP